MDNIKLLFVGIIISMALVIGGVEINPGPHTIDDVFLKLQSLEEKLEKVTSELQRLTKIEQVVQRTKSEVIELKEENERLRRNLDYLEGQSKRNNIIFYGIEENPEKSETWQETEEIVLDILKKHTDINITNDMIERSHRMGKKSFDRTYPRPVVVKLQSFKKKEEILKYYRQLKSVGVAMTEHYSDGVKQTRGKLKKHLIQAKEEGCIVHMRYDKLIINGRTYTLQQCEEYEKKEKRDSNTRMVSESIVKNGEKIQVDRMQEGGISARDPRLAAGGSVSLNDGRVFKSASREVQVTGRPN